MRWLESYMNFKPECQHEVIIINRYADSPDKMFDSIATKYLLYSGGGWDCGTWKFAGQNIDTDLLVCFNSSCVITGDGWLKRFVDAVEEHGDGLYGPLTSFDIIPHVRTPCMIFQPKIVNVYPGMVENREDTYRFEVFGYPDGTPNFTQYTRMNGYKTMLVTWDGVYDLPDWRKPPNIFRRGDQSNLIVKDRHCEAYEVSDDRNKAMLETLADGGIKSQSWSTTTTT